MLQAAAARQRSPRTLAGAVTTTPKALQQQRNIKNAFGPILSRRRDLSLYNTPTNQHNSDSQQQQQRNDCYSPREGSPELSIHEVSAFPTQEKPLRHLPLNRLNSNRADAQQQGGEDASEFSPILQSGAEAHSPFVAMRIDPEDAMKQPQHTDATRPLPAPKITTIEMDSYTPMQKLSIISLHETPSSGGGVDGPSASRSRSQHAETYSSLSPQNHEDEVVRLRKQLLLAQARNRVLEKELRGAREHLNETSMSVGVRETECVELNSLVDSLQGQLDEARRKIQQLEGAHREEEEEEEATTTQQGSDKNTNTGVADVHKQLEEFEAYATDAFQSAERWRGEHNRLARILANTKLMIAQYQAVLDRLNLRPPFTDAMIGSAILRVPHFHALP